MKRRLGICRVDNGISLDLGDIIPNDLKRHQFPPPNQRLFMASRKSGVIGYPELSPMMESIPQNFQKGVAMGLDNVAP